MRRFLKSDVVNDSRVADLMNLDFDDTSVWLKDQDLQIGTGIWKTLVEVKEVERRTFFSDLIRFFRSVSKYLVFICH